MYLLVYRKKDGIKLFKLEMYDRREFEKLTKKLKKNKLIDVYVFDERNDKCV